MATADQDLNLEQLLDVCLHYDFPAAIDILVEKSATTAKQLREAVSNVYTKTDLSVYWNPAREKAAVYARPFVDPQEFDWAITALTEKIGVDRVNPDPLTPVDLQDWWVKVAYSPTLRRMGELLQFFPSKDIPGFGGRPIASTIASGLLGAGLGYGAGFVGEKLLPSWAQGEQGAMRRRLAVLGGLGGASVGAVPGLINWHQNRSFNDPTLWQGHPDDSFDAKLLGSKYLDAVDKYITKQANFDSLGTMGGPSLDSLPLIRTDALGRVLWGTGASPQTTAMTMGAVYGANQMPDPSSRPGVVTPHQMGLFGTMMGAAGGGVQGYVTGKAVGIGLGLLTGMPAGTQKTLANTGAVIGVVNTLVPRLFN
jgi:hypothetical protein